MVCEAWTHPETRRPATVVPRGAVLAEDAPTPAAAVRCGRASAGEGDRRSAPGHGRGWCRREGPGSTRGECALIRRLGLGLGRLSLLQVAMDRRFLQSVLRHEVANKAPLYADAGTTP